MRYYITFGDERFSESRDFAAKMAIRFGGFDKIIAYKPEDIDSKFREDHEDIFNIKRGFGLWLWKPYFIYKTLTEVCKERDMLFYGDGGAFFFRSIKYIEKAMGQDDIWASCNPLAEWQFTKADAFKLLGCDEEYYKRSAQIQGGFLYIRKTERSISFIKKWLDYCCDIRLLHPDNIALNLCNPDLFVSHREDQSVLSLLAKKEGIKFHQDPTQYSKYPEIYWMFNNNNQLKFALERVVTPKGEYPVCIILHRFPTIRISAIIKIFILLLLPHRIGCLIIGAPCNE